VSFRRRVVLLIAAAVSVAIAVASVFVYLLVRSELRDRVDSELVRDANATFEAPVVRETEPRRKGAKPRRRLVLPRGPLGGPSVYAQLVQANGGVVPPVDPAIRLPASPEARAVAAGERDAFFADAEPEGTHVRVYTAPLESGEAIQIARPLDDIDETLSELALILVAVTVAGVAMAAGLGVVVSRAALSPVARLSAAAQEVAATHDLSRRIDPGGGDELGRLAESFNSMLTALEASLSAQRQLVADASHELRTPLTSLRTNIEVLAHSGGLGPEQRERLLADVIAQLGELTALVGDLVDLARGAEPRDQPPARLRLDLLVERAVKAARARAPSVRFRLHASPCTVSGIALALERAIGNLLDNAAKWSPPDGTVEVEVTADGEVSVRDHGPGIDAEDLPYVFDRFYRSAAARNLPGSGLGLAIVRQIVEAGGGTVEAQSHPGGGAVLCVRLPAIPAPEPAEVAWSAAS
jgi:two-component system, OmpR family, sensor histidine kinase MprB